MPKTLNRDGDKACIGFEGLLAAWWLRGLEWEDIQQLLHT